MNMNVRHILLAEDDPRDAKLTLSALAEYNLANPIYTVHDGEDVLDYLYCRGKFKTREGGNPLAILLDLKMPKVDGLEVMKIVKADVNLRTIPIVVLTSSREAPDLIECYEHGVNSYVVKPVGFEDFVKAIKQLGAYWAVVNEPLALATKGEVPVQRTQVDSAGERTINEITTSHPAPGR
jgi:CheY-like chemotaxis protein